MILFELTESEDHPVYDKLKKSNDDRQLDFLSSVVTATLGVNKQFLSQTVIKALNFHAISCLHTHAGEYRPCSVIVGGYEPPAFYRVQALMDDFVNMVNRSWEKADSVTLAAYVLWRLNHIHPFINGNGRTARMASYFVICIKFGLWLPGEAPLPLLLQRDRDEYVEALKKVDLPWDEKRVLDLGPLRNLISRLLREQLADFYPDDPPKN